LLINLKRHPSEVTLEEKSIAFILSYVSHYQ
jgi:hypothetical protein